MSRLFSNKLFVRAFLIAFTSAFLCFMLLWMAALLSFPSQPASQAQQDVPREQTSDQGSLYLPDSSDCMTLLLCEQENPTIFFLLRFDPVRGQIPVLAFPDSLALNLNGTTEPVSKILPAHGLSGLRQAIEQSLGVAVDRQLTLTRQSAIKLLQDFGPTSLTLSEAVDLTVGGISLTLQEGVQLLDGQRLWALLQKQLPQDDLSRCTFLSDFMALCINQHLKYLQHSYSEELFTAVVNASESDLSYQDYDQRRQAAAFLAQLTDSPAQPLSCAFTRNPDATLSFTPECKTAIPNDFSVPS